MSDELITTLASYVPTLIKDRLIVDPTPITAPSVEHFSAAVLFADISGFTALTERLAQRGPVGAEELTHHLNTYFSQLINLIVSHGGDVVKFAGDALIALWPAPVNAADNGTATEAKLADLTRQAAHCGLIIQQQLNAYEVAAGIRLSLKLVLGAGKLLSMQLGGARNRWEFLVAGRPIVQIGAVGHLVNPGDIVLTRYAWALLKEQAAGVVMSDSPEQPVRLVSLKDSLNEDAAVSSLPVLSPEVEPALRAYIPGAILARLAAGQRGWLAELRRVTVIFVNLPHLDYHIPLEQAHIVLKTLQSAVYRYEGSVNKLSVDDKGVTLIAAFGLPPVAHEDDAARAVQTALDMQRELRELGLRSSVGVTTGQAFCGAVGNDQRREYTMIGDVVNLSARLMQAADNSVLCDAATYKATQSAAALELLLGVDLDGSGEIGDVPLFEPLPPLKVKGKAAPIEVYRPRGQYRMTVDLGQLQNRLVGREEEQERLSQLLRRLQQQPGSSSVIIEGEPGMGKTQLVSDLLQQARLGGFKSLIGAGSAIDQSTPYHAWRAIFKQFFQLDALPNEPARRRAHVEKRLRQLNSQQPAGAADSEPSSAPSWERLAPLLDIVLPLDWPENKITRQMSAKVRADNTKDLLVALLQQAVAQGLAADEHYLLILEDAHWLDSASWALTLTVAQQVQPLLMLIVTRPLPEPIPDEVTQLQQLPHSQVMRLDTLNLEEITLLIQECLKVSELPSSVARLIYTKGQGNPFFCQELAYALRDSGALTIKDGRCTAATAHDSQTMHLPDTIQSLITSRIDRLTPSQQLTLKVASVIGRAFDYVTLHSIHPIDSEKSHLPDYLQTLDKLDITNMEQPAPNPAYIFNQTVTQEVAYNMMLFAQRRELHQAVAQWYEQTYADDVSPYYPLLAYHWRKADQPLQAIEYLELAGEEALLNFANEEAVEFFDQALRLSHNPDEDTVPLVPQERRARWEMKLGEAYVNWVKFSEGQAHLEQGLALLGYPAPDSAVRLAAGLTAQVVRQLGHRLWPRLHLGQRRSPKTLREAARAYEGLTAIYYFANKPLASLYAAFCSLNLAEDAGPSPELARGYTSVGAISGFVPLHRSARMYCQRALRAAENINDASARMWTWLGSGMYYAGVGQWETAGGLIERVIDTAEQLGDRYRWDDGVGNLAILTYFRGQFAESLELSDSLFASAQRRNDLHNQAWAMRSKVYCLLPAGRFAESLDCLQTLQSLLAQETDILDEALRIDMFGLLALVQFQLGQEAAALAAADRASQLMAKTSPTSYLSLPGYAGLAEMSLRLWAGRAAAGQNTTAEKRLARRACKMLRGYARVFPIGQPRSRLYDGYFNWLSGRPYVAREQWRTAATLARELQMPYDEALAHQLLGDCLPAADPSRADHIDRTQTLLTQLGIDPPLSLPEAID